MNRGCFKKQVHHGFVIDGDNFGGRPIVFCEAHRSDF